MNQKPSSNELKLAGKVNDLEDAALRPVVAGGGLLVAAINFLFGKVSRGILILSLSLLLCYFAWDSFNSSQQLFFDLQSKHAEAATMVAEAIALNGKNGDKTNARATLEAEIQKTQADAQSAEADLDAAQHSVDGMPAQLAKVRADIAKTQAEADSAKAEADAQTQIIDGLPAATAQLKAEVETAEADVAKEIETDKYLVREYSCQGKKDVFFTMGCQ